MIWVQVALAGVSASFAIAAGFYARRARETAVRAAMAQVRAKQSAEAAERAVVGVPFPNRGS